MKFQHIIFAGAFACALALAQKPAAPPPPPVAPQQQQPHPQQQPQMMVWANSGGSFLGVHATDVDSARARELKLKEEHGVEITRIEPGSPAEKAGILVNDVVLEFGGQRVEGTEQFVRVVRETPAGRQVKIGLWRNGGLQSVTATIGRRKTKTPKELLESLSSGREMPQLPQVWIPDIPRAFTTWKSSMLGLEAEGIEGQLAQFFGVEEGVLVRSVADGSAAEKAGIKAGDVIVKVYGKQVDSPRAVSSEMRALRPRRTFPLGIVREKREISLSVTLEEESENERRERRITQRDEEDR
jgi:serine protease Do